MTATNHALTGAAIGLLIGNPVIALPAALLSHFVCDGLPHFGANDKQVLERHWFGRLLILDAALCVGLVAVLVLNQPLHWHTAAVCAFLATSPDLMWIKQYLRARAHRPAKTVKSTVMRFHKHIQWFERPIGAIVEAAWFVTVGSVIISLLWG